MTAPKPALHAADVAPKGKKSNYPPLFAARVEGREKRALGDLFGLGNFGVNLTRLAPNAPSALRHYHKTQDEFIYILKGTPTLITDEGETELSPGMCAGFKAGTPNGHCLINRTDEEVIYLEIGDRSAGDQVAYPDDDLEAHYENGTWRFTRKDGTQY